MAVVAATIAALLPLFAAASADYAPNEPVPTDCNSAGLWPLTVGISNSFASTYTACIVADQIPAVLDRGGLLDGIGPLTTSVSNTAPDEPGSLTFTYDFSVCQPSCVTYCQGVLAPGDTITCPAVSLLPLSSPAGPLDNNATVVAMLTLTAVEQGEDEAFPALAAWPSLRLQSAGGRAAAAGGGRRAQPLLASPTTSSATRTAAAASIGDNRTASFSLSIDQQCKPTAGGSLIIGRTLCHRVPYGSLDAWTDASGGGGFLAPLYVGLHGCSVDAQECGTAPGEPCCYPGFAQTGGWGNLTSCGERCYDCTRVCTALPSPTPSPLPSSSPTSTATAAAASATPSPSHSGVRDDSSRSWLLLLPALLAAVAALALE